MLRRALAVAAVALASVATCAEAAPRARDEALRRPRKLTVSIADDLLGQLAPDGKRLYFASNRNATSQIFTQDLGAPASTLLFDEGADASWPRVSPDGKRLAYISFADDATGQLCVRDLPSLRKRCLAAGGALEASWGAPDELVLLSRGSVEGDLVVSRVHAGARLSSTPLFNRNLTGPDLSPDGKWLVYVPLQRAAVRIGPAFAAQAARGLVLRRLDTGAETAVTLDLPGGTTQPAFSADGKWLYFTQFLNDTDENGVLDGDDHGVIFRVPFAGDGRAIATADPEQLTAASWNCQYPAPSASALVLTCTHGGGLDVYTLPLDGTVPSSWSPARVRDEADATRDRWQRLLLLHKLARGEKDATARATLLLEVLREHLFLGEHVAAAFHARAVAASGSPTLAPLGPLLVPLIEERRALRAFDRGELGYQYLLGARQRLATVLALAPAEPAAVTLRALVLSELYDHLGDKSAALDELGRAHVDAHTPAFVVQLYAARAEALDRELDRDDALAAALAPIVDHPSLPELERLRLGGVWARTLLRTLSPAAGEALAARLGPTLPPGSARAFSLALWSCIPRVGQATLAAGRKCVGALYAANPSLERRRVLVTEVVRRAESTGAGELEYALVRRWERDVPDDRAENERAERLFRYVVEDSAYGAMAAGRYDEAADEFASVARDTLSLEAHVGFIEASLAAGKDPLRLVAGKPADSPVARFARAYVAMHQLATLDGAAFDRAWQAAHAEVDAAEAELPQKCEVQALHGALLHLRWLRAGDRAAAEEANTHYLLALDLTHDNARYRAMVLEELALLHASVGNFRIAIGHFDARAALPFGDPRVALGHDLGRARALFHVGKEADAAKAADAALSRTAADSRLARFRPLALDRAALYALAAGDGKTALLRYDEAWATAGRDEPHRNAIVRSLARAAAAIAAGQPARALPDLDFVDHELARPDVWQELDWPESTHGEARDAYQLLRLGLRGQAEHTLGKLDEARRTLGERHELLEHRAATRSYDEDLLALSTIDAQLAELERARGRLREAAQLITESLEHADEWAKKTSTPLADQQLAALGFAAELQVVAHAPVDAFGFHVRQRLREAFDRLSAERDPARRETRIRFGVYLTLIALDRPGGTK